MSDHLIGDLTNGKKKIDGQITDKHQNISGSINPLSKNIEANVQNIQNGTKNYEYLVNKPRIEGVEIIGDKTFEDFNFTPLSNADLAQLLD